MFIMQTTMTVDIWEEMTMTIKRALLVGINNYEEQSFKLRGCLNDVFALKELLLTNFGFREKDICVLTNKNATRTSIVESLRTLAKLTKRNDIAVFQFCGYGSYVYNASKLNGYNETLVCYEYDKATGSGQITDDDIKALAKTFRSPGNLTILIDSCYSGDVNDFDLLQTVQQDDGRGKTVSNTRKMYMHTSRNRNVKRQYIGLN